MLVFIIIFYYYFIVSLCRCNLKCGSCCFSFIMWIYVFFLHISGVLKTSYLQKYSFHLIIGTLSIICFDLIHFKDLWRCSEWVDGQSTFFYGVAFLCDIWNIMIFLSVFYQYKKLTVQKSDVLTSQQIRLLYFQLFFFFKGFSEIPL